MTDFLPFSYLSRCVKCGWKGRAPVKYKSKGPFDPPGDPDGHLVRTCPDCEYWWREWTKDDCTPLSEMILDNAITADKIAPHHRSRREGDDEAEGREG